jgi:hypothetical protein
MSTVLDLPTTAAPASFGTAQRISSLRGLRRWHAVQRSSRCRASSCQRSALRTSGPRSVLTAMGVGLLQRRWCDREDPAPVVLPGYTVWTWRPTASSWSKSLGLREQGQVVRQHDRAAISRSTAPVEPPAALCRASGQVSGRWRSADKPPQPFRGRPTGPCVVSRRWPERGARGPASPD